MTYMKTIAAIALLASSFINAQDVWTRQPDLISGSGSRVPVHASYAGGRFLLAGTSSAFWTSASGTSNWAEIALPSPPSGYSSAGMATDGSVVVVAGGSNTIYTTTATSISGLPSTPILWTQLNPGSRTINLGRVRYLNGQFIVAVPKFQDFSNQSNSYTELLTSPDGSSWTSRKFFANAQVNNIITPSDIAFKPGATAGTGTYVLTGDASGYVYVAPENFSSLTRVAVTGLNSTNSSIIYGGGLFVVTTTNGKIFTSPNSTTWTQQTLPGTPSLFAAVFHDGTTFVAVGRQVVSSSSKPMILKSEDGITWSVPGTFDFSIAFSSVLQTLVKADGLWVTTGNSRDLFTSGTSSVGPPAIDPLPPATAGTTGGNITISATIGGSPAPTSVAWLKNGTPISNGPTPGGSVVSGADTDTLTITGATLSDAGNYSVQATNSVATTTSTATQVAISAISSGASFTPYGLENTIGGELLTGSNPAKAMVGITTPTTFSVANGLRTLPNVPTNYRYYGGPNQSGTKILLSNSFALAPVMIYDLTTETGTFLPAIVFPIGPVASASSVLAGTLADNGDFGGSIIGPNNQAYAFHYTASTQTYTVLGNVPNAGNEIATSLGGITTDGTTLSGYERNGFFDGPFVWTTTGGFTLLPVPENAFAANGDIRQISPNGRFIVGFGTASNGAGGGQTAMRWDRVSGSPVGSALTKTLGDTFADARWVIDDGTTVGNVRRGFTFSDNKAAVWLPDGSLVILQDYLSERYGLNLPGYVLNQVTSISPDGKTLAGTANNPSGFVEGWLLTLPDVIEILSPEPDVALTVNTTRTNGADFTFTGSTQIGGGLYPAAFSNIANLGSDSLDVTSFSFSGSNPGDFEIFNAPPSGLTGSYGINEIRSFEIRFNPQPGTSGTRAAVLTLASDDPDTPSFVLNFSGTAAAPATPAETALEDYLAIANVPFNKRGPLDDPDHDGVVNLLEFALGLPAMGPSTLPVAENQASVLSITYTRAQQTHVTYTVKASTDLGVTDPWTATGVTQGTPDGNGVTTATVPISATPRFLRIEVSLVP
jgi:hypothetical protein